MHPKCHHSQEHQARVAASASVTEAPDEKKSLTSMDSGKLGDAFGWGGGEMVCPMDGSDFSAWIRFNKIWKGDVNE